LIQRVRRLELALHFTHEPQRAQGFCACQLAEVQAEIVMGRGRARVARSLAQRLDATGGGPQDVARLEHKIELLEGELADLQRSVEGVQEEMEFVQRLLEDPTRKKSRNS
jgi:hypothetical protein